MKKFLSDVLVDCDLTVSGSTSLGTATGITVVTSDNSTNLATTAWVKSQGYITTNTTYDISVPVGTTKIRLTSSGGVNDDITISAAGASTVSRVSDSEIRITSVDSVDYISNVALNGNSLDFNGTGNAFAGSIDLSTITTNFEATDVETVYARVKNVSGGTLLKGTPLAVVTGQTSGIISDVVAADASDPDLMPAVYILNEDIVDEAEGEAVIYGKITGIDTSLFDSGDTVYVAPGGGWTTTKPIHPNLIQNLGIITKSHPSNGGGEVMGAGRSNDLPNLTAGKIWVGTTNYPIESTTVHIDETNNRVGIGTSAPTQRLHVEGGNISVIDGGYYLYNHSRALSASSTSLLEINKGGFGRVGIYAGGSELLSVTNAGSVGVGTTTPVTNYKLHVVGSSRTALLDNSGLVSIVKITNSGTGNGAYNGLDFVANNTNSSNINSYGMPLTIATSNTNGTAATERMRITGDGNVGIGTASPSEKLHVLGSGKFEVTGTGYGNQALNLYNPDGSTTQVGGVSFRLQSGDFYSQFEAYHKSTGAGQGVAQFGTYDTNSRIVLYSGNSNQQLENSFYKLVVNSNTAAYVTSTGNVGIGTTAPLGKLQINEYTVGANGNQGVHGELSVFANSGDESLFLGIKDASYPNRGWAFNPVTYGVNSNLQIKEHGSTAVRMTIQSGGNVGIGTTSPSHKLQVAGNIYANAGQIYIDNGYYLSGGDATSRIYLGNDGSQGVQIFTDSTERMRIADGGNVGIGTTTPDADLEVAGNVHISGNQNNRLDLDSNVKITGQYYANNGTEYTYLNMYNGANASINMGTKHSLGYISFESGNGAYTERMRITNAGKVGIGLTNPLYELSVSGQISSTNNTGSVNQRVLVEGDVIQPFNAHGQGDNKPKKYLASHLTDRYFGRSSALYVTKDGTELSSYSSIFDGSFDTNVSLANAGDSQFVLNINHDTNGLTNSNGFTYPQGVLKIAFYPGRYGTIDSIRSKDRDGVWRTLTVTEDYEYASSVLAYQAVVPSNNYITDFEITITPQAAGGGPVWLASVEYHGYRMGLGEGGLITTNGGRVYNTLEGRNGGTTTWSLGATGSAYFEGNVGISTTNPTDLLHIRKDQDAATQIRVENTSNTSNSRASITVGSAGNAITMARYLSNYTAVSSWANRGGILTDSGLTNGFFFRTSAGAISFQPGSNNDSVVFDTSGNVGIGTTSPAAKLVVAGTAYINQTSDYFGISNTKVQISAGSSSDNVGIRSNKLYLYSYANGADSQLIFGDGTAHWALFANDNRFSLYNYATSATSIHVSSTGNVGIGTTSPGSTLTVHKDLGTGGTLAEFKNSNSTYSQQMYLSFNSTKDVIWSQGSSSGGTVINTGTRGHSFAVNGTTNVVFNGSGNVGIGNTNPSMKLDVVGGVKSSIGFQAYITESSDADNIFLNGLKYGIILNGSANLPVPGNSHYANLGNIAITHYDAAAANDFYIKAKSFNGNTSWGKIWTDQNFTPTDYIPTTDYNDFVNVAGDTMTGNLLPGTDSTLRLGNSTNRWLQVHTRSVTSDGNTLDLKGSAVKLYNGTNTAMTIDSNGNVGIGTTSPTTKLDVAGAVQVRYSNDHTTGDISVNKSALDLYNPLEADTDEKGSIITFSDNYQDANGFKKTTRAAIKGGTDQTGNTAAGFLAFYTDSSSANSATERMRIDDTGNVGIGTTTPAEMLDVAGNARAENVVAETRAYAGIGFEHWGDGGTGMNFPSNDVVNLLTAGTTRLGISSGGTVTINSNGQEGWSGNKLNIGTTSDGANGINILTSATGNAYIIFSDVVDGSSNEYANQIRYSHTDNFLAIQTVGSERLRIDSSGNIGIGTTSPSYKLDVAGDARINNYLRFSSTGTYIRNSASGALVLAANSGYVTTGWGARLQVPDGSGTVAVNLSGTVDSYINGVNFGIGTTTPSEKLHVAGNVRIDGDLTISGSYTQIDTNVNTTEQWLVTNDGTGPAAIINQIGAQPIIDIQDDGVSAFFIEDGGNVGIGVTDPTAKLDIAAGASGAQTLLMVGNNGNGNIKTRHIEGKLHNSTANDILHLNYYADDDVSIVAGGGNVMIGAGTATQKLEVAGNVKANRLLLNTSNTGYTLYSNGESRINDVVFASGGGADYVQKSSGTGSFYVRNNLSGYLAYFGANNSSGQFTNYVRVNGGGNNITIRTNDSDRVYINSAGNVGIGTTSPTNKLEVVGSTQSTSYKISSGAYMFDVDATYLRLYSNGAGWKFTSWDSGYVDRITIKKTGEVGIGTTSPSEKLEVNGNVKASNLIADKGAGIYTFSDTVTASTSEDIFSISCSNGAQAFRVAFTCSTSGMSVAKIYEVVHAYGAAPVFFKVVDTGAYQGHDFDVSFSDVSSTGLKATITNNSATKNADIVTTVFLGGSPTDITVTAL